MVLTIDSKKRMEVKYFCVGPVPADKPAMRLMEELI